MDTMHVYQRKLSDWFMWRSLSSPTVAAFDGGATTWQLDAVAVAVACRRPMLEAHRGWILISVKECSSSSSSCSSNHNNRVDELTIELWRQWGKIQVFLLECLLSGLPPRGTLTVGLPHCKRCGQENPCQVNPGAYLSVDPGSSQADKHG